jgi:protoporphyrinogen oxidase
MDRKIVIIGGGVSGLVAAIHCEKAGYAPIVIEAGDRAGGRIKTDHKDGFILDHGFQVLLTAYQEAQRYLDYESLDLKAFSSGAIIFDGEKSYTVSDPLREPSKMFSMVSSPVGSLKDKYLIWKLTQRLKGQKEDMLFLQQDQTTLEFLQSFGFSDIIIERFFHPFFGGIFLENDLRTKAGMFKFVFKKFSEGLAAIPAQGIEEIPKQLKAQLKNTTFHFNRKAVGVDGKKLRLDEGDPIEFDKLIITIDPSHILSNLKGQKLDYVGTTTLYYQSEESILNAKSIALVSMPDHVINNFCVLTDVAPSYSKSGASLISVTVKDRAEKMENLEDEVALALKKLTGTAAKISLVARYDIPHALPVNDEMRFDLQFTSFTLTDDIYLAGDYLLNASLDAAMRSGRNAATAALNSL